MSSPKPTPQSSPAAPKPASGGGFQPVIPTIQPSASSHYLPSDARTSPGEYDWYNVGDMYNATIFLGSDVDPGNDSKDPAERRQLKESGVLSGPTTTNTIADPVKLQQDFASYYVNNPQLYAAMQQQLYAAHFYGSGKPANGLYGDDDVTALNSAVRQYLRLVNPATPNALTLSEFLDRAASQGSVDGIGGGGGPARAPLQLTSVDTLNEAANNQAQNELGRNADTGEQAGFVSKYHGKEQAAYNGATEQPGDVSTEAKSFVDSTANPEMQTHLQAGYASKILSMLGVQS